MDSRVKFDKAQKYTPHYVRVDGKKRYFRTAKEAEDSLVGRTADMVIGPRAISEYRSAKALLPPGTSLVYVARTFMAQTRMDMSRSVTAAIEDYVAARESEPHIRPRYLARIKQVMEWFRRVAGDTALAGIGYGEIETYCRNRGTLYQQHEARTHLSVFFGYCFRRQWVDKNPADARIVTIPPLPEPVPEALKLDDARKILEGAWEHARDLVAPFAIQMFCGVRTEEMTRLWWDNVALDRHVDIPARVAKTGERRVIDWWPDNLTSWIKPLKSETGLVAPNNYSVRRALLLKKINATPPKNAFRRSYATYGVALHQDAAKIALMMGHHDANLIFRHYRGYATQEDGKAYFSIAR